MKITAELIRGRFLRRLNRFLVEVEIGAAVHLAHLPNSGRLNELLVSGSPAALLPVSSSDRKTGYDLVQIEAEGVWVSCDARLPSSLVIEAIEAGRLPELGPVSGSRREVGAGSSRLDLLLSGPEGDCFVECKSVTLVREGTALFPDSPTARGARHMLELRSIAAAGGRAAAVFVVQRPDAARFRPNAEADPLFATAYSEAAESGVKILACRCTTAFGNIEIADRLEIAPV